MSVTLGIVEIGSSRFSSKDLQRLAERRLGNHSLLHWIVRRVSDSLHLDRIVVLADSAYEPIARQLAPADATVFASRRVDGLSRCLEAAEHFEASQLVRVTLDSPFVDPSLIDRLVSTAYANPGCDYIGYYLNSGQPAVRAPLGVFAEWCRVAALEQADQAATDPAERQAVTRYLYTHPEIFQLRLIPAPPELDRNDVRLLVDIEEDWEHAQAIIDAIGGNDVDWRTIASLLNAQPEMRQRMAILNQCEGS